MEKFQRNDFFFVFVCLSYSPDTFFNAMKGGSCEGESLPSFPIGPTCKVRFGCPSSVHLRLQIP